MKQKEIITIAIIGGIAFMLYKFGNSLFSAFTGGSEGQEARALLKQQQAVSAKQNPWKPEYTLNKLKIPSGEKVYLLTVAAKQQIIEEIEGAGKWGMWGRLFGQSADKTISNIFHNKIKYKTQLSDLSKFYKDITGNDLLSTINTKLNKTQGILSDTAESNYALKSLINYANNLL